VAIDFGPGRFAFGVVQMLRYGHGESKGVRRREKVEFAEGLTTVTGIYEIVDRVSLTKFDGTQRTSRRKDGALICDAPTSFVATRT